MLKRLRISHRLMLFIPVLLIALMVVIGFGLSVLKDSLLEDRKEQLRQTVGVVRGMVQGWQDKEAAGQLTREQAQQAARDQIRPLRFGAGDYFFATRYDGVTMVHVNTAFEGKNRIDFKTADGVPTVRLQIEAAQRGGDFFRYRFPDPARPIRWRRSPTRRNSSLGNGPSAPACISTTWTPSTTAFSKSTWESRPSSFWSAAPWPSRWPAASAVRCR